MQAGVGHVRQAAEHYRDVLGFSLDPVDGVFQPTADESFFIMRIKWE